MATINAKIWLAYLYVTHEPSIEGTDCLLLALPSTGECLNFLWFERAVCV